MQVFHARYDLGTAGHYAMAVGYQDCLCLGAQIRLISHGVKLYDDVREQCSSNCNVMLRAYNWLQQVHYSTRSFDGRPKNVLSDSFPASNDCWPLIAST